MIKDWNHNLQSSPLRQSINPLDGLAVDVIWVYVQKVISWIINGAIRCWLGMTHQCKNSFMSAKTKWRRWVQKDARIAKKASLITEHNRANFFMVLRRRLVVALKTSKTNCTHWVLHQIRLTFCFASLNGRIKLELGRYRFCRKFCND